jgi:IclR family acetate operon transcriptional repressor
VLLAHQSHHSVATALERCGMRQYTERTQSSADNFRFELASVKTAGTARDREGAVEGVCCHAAPIFDSGQVVAAISISVSTSSEERLADRYDEIVRAAGIAISSRLTASNTSRDRSADAVAV